MYITNFLFIWLLGSLHWTASNSHSKNWRTSAPGQQGKGDHYLIFYPDPYR